MKIIAKLVLLLVVLAASVTVYAAVCRATDGSKACGSTCTTSGASCSCEGTCTAREYELVLQ